MNNKLPNGNYMKVKAVMNYFRHENAKSTLASIIEKTCPVCVGEYSDYYNTEDIKTVINPDLFREMECHVTTHMIGFEKYLAS